MVAPFVHRLLRALTQSPSLRSIIMDVTALSAAALYDALFLISDLPQAIPAYIVLLLRAFTINALNRVTQRLTLDILSPDLLRLSSSWPPLYSPFPSMPLAEQYPSFPPTLLPLPSYHSCCSSCSHPPSQAASSTTSHLLSHTSQPSSTRPSSHHYSLNIGHGLTCVSFLLSTMHSSQAPPACDDRATLLISKVLLQSYLRIILACAEPRGIFYTLLLNLFSC